MRAKVLIALTLALMAAPVHAQNYPARPIKLVVPFAAGGPGDTVARLLAQAMSKGQTVVVENVSGAGGNIGATYVSRAAPDGYTLLFHQLGMAISPFLYSKLEYDPLDFETIGMVAYQANVLITRPKIVPGTFQDFLNYLKANREKLSFASTGPGGASDLCAILFKSATGIDIKTVPYRATAPALTDILGGNVDLLVRFGGDGDALHPGRQRAGPWRDHADAGLKPAGGADARRAGPQGLRYDDVDLALCAEGHAPAGRRSSVEIAAGRGAGSAVYREPAKGRQLGAAEGACHARSPRSLSAAGNQPLGPDHQGRESSR